MIIAVEVRKNKWDFSCTNNDELYKALAIDCEKLDVKFIDFTKYAFGAYSPNMNLVTKSLSKRGVVLFYEAKISPDNFTERNRGPVFAGSPVDYSRESPMVAADV